MDADNSIKSGKKCTQKHYSLVDAYMKEPATIFELNFQAILRQGRLSPYVHFWSSFRGKMDSETFDTWKVARIGLGWGQRSVQASFLISHPA